MARIDDPATLGVPGAGSEYWVNMDTGAVEEGRKSGAGHRMGPYATRAEAQQAYDTAAVRNETWDEDDDRWRKEWDDDDDAEGGGGAVT